MPPLTRTTPRPRRSGQCRRVRSSRCRRPRHDNFDCDVTIAAALAHAPKARWTPRPCWPRTMSIRPTSSNRSASSQVAALSPGDAGNIRRVLLSLYHRIGASLRRMVAAQAGLLGHALIGEPPAGIVSRHPVIGILTVGAAGTFRRTHLREQRLIRSMFDPSPRPWSPAGLS
jgi:hypothetical protein